MALPRRLGVTLLGVWLVATGLMAILPLPIPGLGLVMAVLAIVAGIALLAGR